MEWRRRDEAGPAVTLPSCRGGRTPRGWSSPNASAKPAGSCCHCWTRVGWKGDENLVLLAVQEALTNAVRHGRGLRRASAQVSGGELVVEVADYGKAFEAGPYVRSTPDLLAARWQPRCPPARRRCATCWR